MKNGIFSERRSHNCRQSYIRIWCLLTRRKKKNTEKKENYEQKEGENNQQNYFKKDFPELRTSNSTIVGTS